MQTGSFLRQWRETLAISAHAVADRAGVPLERFERIEAGTVQPSFAEIELVAAALGLRSDELLEDEVSPAAAADPVRMLMKSAEAFRPNDDVRLRVVDAARAALDLLTLREKLKRPKPKLAGFSPQAPIRKKGEAVFELGSKLAKEFRSKLQIRGPIESVRNLLIDDLGIPVVAADLTSLGPEALSVYAPNTGMAIVLNARGKNENKLVARFSLLHELAHVLIDRPAQGSMGIACRRDLERNLDIEVRANAFAMRMLIPERELNRHRKDIWDPKVFRSVMEEWGVHRSALALYAGKLLGLDEREAEELAPSVDTTAPLSIRNAEELAAERERSLGIPLARSGELLRLVIEGLAAKHLTRGEARAFLRVDAATDLTQVAEVLDLPLGA